jgi:hypothetical protein
MLNCPKCDHPILNSNAVTCPHCGTTLKAYGHPGVTLHRASKGESLCETCTYHADDTCNFPKRPHAQECTLYDDINQRQLEKAQQEAIRPDLMKSVRLWSQRNRTLLGLLGLFLVCILFTLMATR